VRKGKSYVSFHLIPVYMFPDLLKGLSPALEKRMQGKSCFNFKTVREPWSSYMRNRRLKWPFGTSSPFAVFGTSPLPAWRGEGSRSS
jgi:hypothetical protein